MVRIDTRLYSSTASASCTAAAEFLKKATQKGSLLQEQFIDANQLQKFSLALNRPKLYETVNIESKIPPEGTPVPPGYHLAYFTPQGCEQDLGLDGTDSTVNPPYPFIRRMWAGGSLSWDKWNPIRVGQTVKEITKILSAKPKQTRAGQEMIVVEVEKKFVNELGTSLVDQRYISVFK
jgi:hydroxyacyl-ACP dehydratase HTD2-like protein with hotdog domain